jgi:hypothetical protein
MPERQRAATAPVLLVISLLVGAALAISGCGGGGDSTAASTAADEPPTAGANALRPYVTLGKCEPLYEHVYSNTARKIAELGAAGSKATPGELRELEAAETKHEQALEFCEEEIELVRVRARERATTP